MRIGISSGIGTKHRKHVVLRVAYVRYRQFRAHTHTPHTKFWRDGNERMCNFQGRSGWCIHCMLIGHQKDAYGLTSSAHILHFCALISFFLSPFLPLSSCTPLSIAFLKRVCFDIIYLNAVCFWFCARLRFSANALSTRVLHQMKMKTIINQIRGIHRYCSASEWMQQHFHSSYYISADAQTFPLCLHKAHRSAAIACCGISRIPCPSLCASHLHSVVHWTSNYRQNIRVNDSSSSSTHTHTQREKSLSSTQFVFVHSALLVRAPFSNISFIFQANTIACIFYSQGNQAHTHSLTEALASCEKCTAFSFFFSADLFCSFRFLSFPIRSCCRRRRLRHTDRHT